MKYLFTLLIVLSVSGQTFARSCSERLKAEVKEDALVGGVITTLGGAGTVGAVAGVVVGHTIFLPIIFGGGVALLWQAGHEKSIAKMLEQAESCKGKKITKLWLKFNRKYPLEAENMTKREFCTAINEANKSGAACGNEVVPERSDILKIAF